MPMTVVVAGLSVITWRVSVWRGDGFWDVFYPQFLATVFGVAFTIMLTYAIWLQQQKGRRARQHQQLVRDLKFEVDENLKRLVDLEAFLDEDGTVSQREGTLRIRDLRTAVMKYALRPENLVLLQDPDLENDIDWVGGHCEEFNQNFRHRFQRFLADLGVNPEHNGPSRAKMGLRLEILPEADFMRGILERLGKKLEEHGTRGPG